ncbi:MAG: hypothetical protein IPG24_15220 [Leptospiraceae bacterium]|nr:hypothetical protein [Leptospiraceae bacterium]
MPKKHLNLEIFFNTKKIRIEKFQNSEFLLRHAIGGIKRLRGVIDVFRNIKKGFL